MVEQGLKREEGAVSRHVGFARPRDRSLQAFKDWVKGMAKHLGVGSDDRSMSDEKWAEMHARFWSKADAAAEEEGSREMPKGESGEEALE